MVDSIGIAQLAVAPAPVPSAPHSENIPPPVSLNPAPAQPVVVDQVDLSAQAAQQPVQPKVEYANPEVLGTTNFSLYRAADGTLVTRSVDRQTGKVTYEPQEEPVLGSNSGNAVQSLVNITA